MAEPSTARQTSSNLVGVDLYYQLFATGVGGHTNAEDLLHIIGPIPSYADTTTTTDNTSFRCTATFRYHSNPTHWAELTCDYDAIDDSFINFKVVRGSLAYWQPAVSDSMTSLTSAATQLLLLHGEHKTLVDDSGAKMFRVEVLFPERDRKEKAVLFGKMVRGEEQCLLTREEKERVGFR